MLRLESHNTSSSAVVKAQYLTSRPIHFPTSWPATQYYKDNLYIYIYIKLVCPIQHALKKIITKDIYIIYDFIVIDLIHCSYEYDGRFSFHSENECNSS
jgi:hypothetical protein